MKWIIGGFVVALIAIKVAFSEPAPATPPVINLDAGPHNITQEITCIGDNVFTIATYVDGVYRFTTTNRPPTPQNLRVTQ